MEGRADRCLCEILKAWKLLINVELWNCGIVESWNVNHWNGEDSLHDRTFVVATSKS